MTLPFSQMNDFEDHYGSSDIRSNDLSPNQLKEWTNSYASFITFVRLSNQLLIFLKEKNYEKLNGVLSAITPFFIFTPEFIREEFTNLLLIMGWAVSYFPFLRIPRTMFHYHYLVPLMFAVMNLFSLVDVSFKNKPKCRGYFCTLLIVLDVLCYLFFAPMIYGNPCPNCWSTRIWSKRWVDGPPKVVATYGLAAFNTTKLTGILPP